MGEAGKPGRHAFISYVSEDSIQAGRLHSALEASGIPVWRDAADLWPGEDWRATIRQAITSDALAFIACFSRNSLARDKSYQNEEILLAIEELRERRLGLQWLIPVRFDNCEIPDMDIGGGRTLTSLQHADLFGERSDEEASRLVTAVLRILGPGQADRSRSGRYDTAIGKLASDSLAVRVAGIHALNGIAGDSPADAPAIMMVLAALILDQSSAHRPAAGPGTAPPQQQPRPDVQAAATFIGQRDADHSPPLNLRGARLAGVDLGDADLTVVDLSGADLTGANLAHAHFFWANLTGANLTGATLAGANLCSAEYGNADFTRANLRGARLVEVDLRNVDLQDADLREADLARAIWPANAAVPEGWRRNTDGRMERDSPDE